MANPLTLESVSAAFDHWRQNRTSRKESVPISLREHAIKLLAHHSKSRVIEALKINHSMLKQWRHKGERCARRRHSLFCHRRNQKPRRRFKLRCVIRRVQKCTSPAP